MILALGILAGSGTGLLVGFMARKQKRDWAAMEKKDKITTILLILACSATITAVLAWYVLSYAAL
jgi:small-conductance mechanosensitive channel